MNTVQIIIYGLVMAIFGFLYGFYKSYKAHKTKLYNKGWEDCEKTLHSIYLMYPKDNLPEDDEEEPNKMEHMVEFYKAFDELMTEPDDVIDPNEEGITGTSVNID